jgi:Protein of unknown function (DUF2568)
VSDFPEEEAIMTPAERVNLALRATLELGVVAGFGYWGFHAGRHAISRAALAIGAPAVGFGFWGAVDFRGAGAPGEWLRLAQELLISGLAGLAFYASGQHTLAWTLIALSIAYHALLYATGGRLLRPRVER